MHAAVVDVEWEDETSPAKIVKISSRYGIWSL